MTIEQLGKILETGGPWTICALLVFGIVYIYRNTNKTIDKVHEQYSELLERRNDQFIEALQQTSAALQASTDEAQRVENVLGRVERILDRRDER